MVHIYHGFGKGKTTAAIGLAIRQLGAGKTVTFAQFLKDGTSSEVSILKQVKITYMHTMMPKCFFKDMSKQEQDILKSSCQEVLYKAVSSSNDCIILDEFLDVLHLGILQEDDVLQMLDKLTQKEVVLTGRNPSEQMIQFADYCSECIAVKHPYQKGIKARKGVEF